MKSVVALAVVAVAVCLSYLISFKKKYPVFLNGSLGNAKLRHQRIQLLFNEPLGFSLLFLRIPKPVNIHQISISVLYSLLQYDCPQFLNGAFQLARQGFEVNHQIRRKSVNG